MKKFTRKLLSIVLTLAMVVTMVPAFGVTANAATNFNGWTKIDGTTTISKSGSYYLDGDVTGNIIVESEVTATLDLNGHVLNGDGNGSVITNKGTLTVVDTANENNVHYFKVNEDGLWVLNTAISSEDYTFDATYGLKTAAGADTTDIPVKNKIIKVTGGCITGGSGTKIFKNTSNPEETTSYSDPLSGSYAWDNQKNGQCGGGILNYGNLTVKDTTIIGNKVDIPSTDGSVYGSEGGGICSFSNELKLSGAAVVGNACMCYGGGIFCRYGGDISNSKVCYNKAVYSGIACQGGGIHNHQGTLKIDGSEIIGNTTSGSGGGIRNYGPSKNKDENKNLWAESNIYNTTISGNKAGRWGGAIFNDGTLTVSDAIVSENKAECGAGIFNFAIVTLSNVEVTRNESTIDGIPSGGVYSWYDDVVEAVTLSGKVNISGNTTVYSGKTYNGNLCLSGENVNGKVKLDNLTSESNIGVTVMVKDVVKSGAFTASSADYSNCFTSDSLAYKVKFNNQNTAVATDDYLELVKYNITAVPNYTESITLEKDNMTKEQAIAIMTADTTDYTVGSIVAYAVSGGGYSCVQYNNGTWEKAASKSLADLKSAKSYVIGTVAIGSSEKATTINTDGNDKTTQIQVTGDNGVQASGLESVATGIKNQDENANKSVKVVLDVKETTETEADDLERGAVFAIKSEAGEDNFENLELLSINMTKYVGENNGVEITNTDNIVELIIPFDTMGKKDITIYRYHKDDTPSVTTFTETTREQAGADGTFYIENNKLHMFTNKFSTYAIAYNDDSNSVIKTLASIVLGTTVATLIYRVFHKNDTSWISTLTKLFTRCFKTAFPWKLL